MKKVFYWVLSKFKKNSKMDVNLIVTLGDRDLTINKEIEGVELRRNPVSNKFYLANNVDGADFIINDFDKLYNQIEFPIIIPAIEYVLAQHKEINKLILVSTNQEKIADVSDYHKRKDTFKLAKLLNQYLRKKYGSKVAKIKDCYVNDNIIYHDSMFDAFAKKLADHPFKFQLDDSVYLFAQSGIDAINTALLLNCIEQYPQTVQLNKPESSPVAFPLTFPKKFYRRLLKGKVLHALENFNYAAIIDLNYSPELNAISKYAFSRMAFDFDGAKEQLAQLCTIDEGNRSFYTNLMVYLDFKESDLQGKIVEMYLSAKVLLKRYAYSDFLVRIFTITEIILKPRVIKLLNGDFDYTPNDDHKAWNELLAANPELLEHLSKSAYGANFQLKYKEPNKFVYKAIIDYFNKKNGIADDSFNSFFNHLLELSFLRNKVAHGLIKVNEADINQALKKIKSNLEQFIGLADKYFGVEDMGDYEKVNSHIKLMIEKD
ncbi:MAG: hypothetical protein PHE56_14595 [Bacteroidales bacterium]|nr:hypothetical protein [Bacteroidales bacterium]